MRIQLLSDLHLEAHPHGVPTPARAWASPGWSVKFSQARLFCLTRLNLRACVQKPFSQ